MVRRSAKLPEYNNRICYKRQRLFINYVTHTQLRSWPSGSHKTFYINIGPWVEPQMIFKVLIIFLMLHASLYTRELSESRKDLQAPTLGGPPRMNLGAGTHSCTTHLGNWLYKNETNFLSVPSYLWMWLIEVIEHETKCPTILTLGQQVTTYCLFSVDRVYRKVKVSISL